MTVAITGATGMVGSALRAHLERTGCTVRTIGRGRSAPVDIAWDPMHGVLAPSALVGVGAIVHLAGETIGQRWTTNARRRIRESRVRGTRLIAETIAGMNDASRPRALISMSAVGCYGDRGDELLDDSSSPGAGFLADVVRAWEHAAEPAERAGVRVVHPRMGVVLHGGGGMLGRLLPIFRLGLGGRVGSGRQFLSWIAIDDAVAGIDFLLRSGELHGAVNLTSPGPVTNARFTEALGTVLHRPVLATVPAPAIRLLYGDMGEELLLGGQRAVPRTLETAGFRFAHPDIEGALRAAIAND
jgi:uncharacterized protein (TIGR01777 family)